MAMIRIYYNTHIIYTTIMQHPAYHPDLRACFQLDQQTRYLLFDQSYKAEAAGSCPQRQITRCLKSRSTGRTKPHRAILPEAGNKLAGFVSVSEIHFFRR